MGSGSDETSFYRILVAVETDATRYYGSDAQRPRRLDHNQAGQMVSHLGADLSTLLPEISSCSLIAAGALFDQTQVLRPAYPVFEALESVAANPDTDKFKASLVAIGTREERMPDAALEPDSEIPLGLLQLLPCVIHGPAIQVEALGQAMEYRFLEEGQVSPHSANWLASAFGVSINHARFMTLTDLNAMLRLQLEHFGFLPLWELLDAALGGSRQHSVTTESGQAYEWRDGAVHTAFQTFDYWSSKGGGSEQSALRQALAAGYGEWTREKRQYLTTLRAHGLEICFHLPGEKDPLEGSFLCETSRFQAGPRHTSLTEHSFSELGTVAVTSVNGESVENYYPLLPQGLNDIHSHLRDRVPHGHTVAFPGTLLYDESQRCLLPDSGWK